MALQKKFDGKIINFTPTGMIPTKDMTKHVPLTPKEIIKDALECAELGVNMIHLHARDENGVPTYKKELYKEIICGIREKRSDLILIATCSGRNFSEFEKRSEVLELKGDAKPDMGSLTLSSLNFNKQASVNDPNMIKSLAQKMLDNGIKPELEVFDVGMLNYARYLARKGIIKSPFYYNFIIGNIACAQATLLHMGVMLQDVMDDSLVTMGGVGDVQQDVNVVGVIFANGSRTGLEDNIYFDKEKNLLATNKQLIERIRKHIEVLGYRVATSQEIRNFLKL